MHRLLRLMLLFFVLVACGMQSTVPANADEGRLFPVTGFRVRGEFLSYWETNGGLPVFGYPVSAELWEDGRVVQYFERNRFELHPDKAAPFNVLLGLLGIERLQASGRDWRTQQQGKARDGCLFFAETNHSLCGEFRQYWEKHGGLAIFGYPITEPAQEVSETDGNTYTVQYFERNRFELHPENKPPYNVLLGLLGSWRTGWLLNEARQPHATRASIIGVNGIQNPLTQITLTIDPAGFRGNAELRVFDGAGRLEGTQALQFDGTAQNVSWRTSGTLGKHSAALVIDGKIAALNSNVYTLDAQTQVQTGIDAYDQLVPKVREFLTYDVSEYEYKGYKIRGYRSPDSYLIWLRDHMYQGQGYKYFDPDMTSTLDYFAREQKANGAFDDYFAILNGVPIQGRTDVEADLEYLFVMGAYQAWQATGDTAWLRAQIPSMEKGIKYSTSEPIRWDASKQLIKRPYTIDTWDFEYGGPTIAPDGKEAPRHWIDDKTRFGIMHGDNTGMARAMQLMSRIYGDMGQAQTATEWRIRADQLMNNLNAVSWNGRFFTHNVLEQPFEIAGVDQANQLSLSNAYALNRNVLSGEQARAIIAEYYRRRIADPRSIPSEWYSIDPPFPADSFGTTAGWGKEPGEYVNGGRMPLVGGELAHGAFTWGQSVYGFDILKRYYQMISLQNGTYLWYYPDGNPGISSPQTLSTDGWGSTAMLAALLEGAAGIKDNGALYHDVTISPRWTADSEVTSANVTTRYAASLGYVSYRWQRGSNSLNLDMTGSNERATIRLLLPADAPASVNVTINGQGSSGRIRTEGEERFVEFTVLNPTNSITVSW